MPSFGPPSVPWIVVVEQLLELFFKVSLFQSIAVGINWLELFKPG